MPASLKNEYDLSIRKLIKLTYQYFPSRIDTKERDIISRIKIKEIKTYSGSTNRKKFIIESSSYPQYNPYFTKKDSRGRERGKQRAYKHKYDVTIQLDTLSVDTTGIKLRTGADARWDFTSAGRPKKDSRGKIKEGTNVKRGLNGDFFFRLSYAYKKYGILFGRNWAVGAPTKTNPKQIPFLDKHALHVIETLVNIGVLQ